MNTVPPSESWVGVVGLAVWLVGASVVWLMERNEPSAETAQAQSTASLAWPGTGPSPLVAEDPPPGAAGVTAPPVESLVQGLEARLEVEPNDAEGWALLAQSYAFTSNEEAVERAVRRAVELGVDEAMLRERVASAKRRAPPVDWVEEALRAGRSR